MLPTALAWLGRHRPGAPHPASFDDCCDWERGASSGVYLIVGDMLSPVDAKDVAEAVAVKCIESAAGVADSVHV